MKISVLICTYNGELYIKDQLNSIVNQTVLPNEIIISDDCSSDNTLNICKDFSCKYKNIKWIIKKNSKNKGYKKNFLESLKLTNGKYIFLCDQDDIWNKNKIEKMINIMKKNENINLLMSDVEMLYMSNFTKRQRLKHFLSFKNIIKINIKRNFCNTPRPGCTFCITDKYKYMDYDKYNYKYAHDLLIWQIASLQNEAFLCKDKLIKFRRHAQNASDKASNLNNRINFLRSRKNLLEIFKKDYDGIYKEYIHKEKKFIEKRLFYFENKKSIAGIFYTLIKFYRYPTFINFLSEIYYHLRNGAKNV